MLLLQQRSDSGTISRLLLEVWSPGYACGQSATMASRLLGQWCLTQHDLSSLMYSSLFVGPLYISAKTFNSNIDSHESRHESLHALQEIPTNAHRALPKPHCIPRYHGFDVPHAVISGSSCLGSKIAYTPNSTTLNLEPLHQPGFRV